MKISLATLEDFIDEIAFHKDKISEPVRFSAESEAVNKYISKVFGVATAASQSSDASILIEWSGEIGTDMEGDLGGSDAWKMAADTLSAACSKLGLILRAGKIEEL